MNIYKDNIDNSIYRSVRSVIRDEIIQYCWESVIGIPFLEDIIEDMLIDHFDGYR